MCSCFVLHCAVCGEARQQDQIHVARCKVGFEYVFIASFCIVQALEKLNSLQALQYALTHQYDGGKEELKQRLRGEADLRGMLLSPKSLANRALAPPMWASGGPEG